jgi:hypothetical protein
MGDVLVYILIICLVGGAAALIIQWAPGLDARLKQYALYAVGAVVLVLIVLALIPLLQHAT